MYILVYMPMMVLCLCVHCVCGNREGGSMCLCYVPEHTVMASMCSFSLQESNYFTPQGEFRVDAGGSQTLLNCLMYKLAYFRFGEVGVMLSFYCLCHYGTCTYTGFHIEFFMGRGVADVSILPLSLRGDLEACPPE